MQIFLQGKASRRRQTSSWRLPAGSATSSSPGRSHWISLLSEMLPRALLAELGLAKILLGSSGGGQFLLVLPEESRAPAEAFLAAAAKEIAALSDGVVKLIWSVTENLGDWSDVRRRLDEQMSPLRGTPCGRGLTLRRLRAEWPESAGDAKQYFAQPARLEAARRRKRRLVARNARPHSGRRRQTRLEPRPDRTESLPFARHAAPNDAGTEPASTETLASRAAGLAPGACCAATSIISASASAAPQSIEEHIQLSVMYKQFFAGELEVLCSMPEFWRKVTVIYSGGDDFAVYGAWDALIGLAREMERLFRRFAEANSEGLRGTRGQDHHAWLWRWRPPKMRRSARCSKKPASVWKRRNRPTRIASGCWAARSNGSSSPKPPT